ncbi:hypothetical protein BV22DRAFT_1052241 [Leucogyrophana mollusca]|uniref:Uncharacterized protein n=1 Tax=Leucogyrophana mollusca TaxID=85980 RepID=A0ACB8AWP8_9AGAM|nr:hypothetical protein BV22DRAFT_1052241 [Leucogyrophana mollusca]
MEAEIAEAVYDLRALQQTAFVGVAALVVALYDHVQSFAQEVEFIWNRYLGNAMLIAGATVSVSHVLSDRVCYGLLEFEAWGTLMCAWVVQGVMQLRIFAMYHGSKKICILLGVFFFAEIVTTAAVLWFNVGPKSPFGAASTIVITNRLCVATGVRGNFMVMTYVPILCFDVLLFCLAARISAKDALDVIRSGGVGRVSSLMKVLARDSLIYFLMHVMSIDLNTGSNLILMIVIVVGWVGLPAIYSEGIPVPLIDFVLAITNSRLILGLRARRARAGVQIGDNTPAGVGGGMRVMDEGIPMHVLNIRRCDP